MENNKTQLISTNLSLTSLNKTDFDQLLSWIDSEKTLIQWAGPTMFTWLLDKVQLTKYLARSQGEFPHTYIYKVVEQSSENFVGLVEFDKIDWEKKTTVLSRAIINPALRGKKMGHKLVQAAVDFGFNVLHFTEIKLSVYTFNLPAIRCYEKVGFKTKEIIKNCCKVGSESWDTLIMSILPGSRGQAAG